MLNFLPKTLIGVITSILLGLNTILWCCILYLFAVVKLLLPFKGVSAWIDPIENGLAENWISCNSGWMRLTQRAQWDVEGFDGLKYEGWYLVNANHQTWADIFVLQHLLNRKIPFMKFLTKRVLILVPFIGFAWWALDYPFMRRFSREYLQKHPEMRGKDLETTRRACAKFSLVPTSVMNFIEGTRFTKEKHRAQASPYKHLLKPRAGGFALLLNAMGGKFQSLLNVTVVYPDGAPDFWDFLCGRMQRVIVRMQKLSIPEQLMKGDYEGDPAFREVIQQWIHQLWLGNDALFEKLLGDSNPA
jgi:1-acyl-sn-glycerol-3-phosphate acyltransferase